MKARAIGAYLCLALPIAFLWLGARDVRVMEGIVADGARYMERSDEYAVPRLHGEIYAYKPPGAYWLALASMSLVGVDNEWTLRLPFAATAVLMGLVILLVAADVLGPRGGFWCAVSSITGAIVLQKIHLAEWDVALAAGVGVASVVAARNFALAKPNSALWLVGYLGLSAGSLVKGLPALLLYAPGLLVAALVTRQVRQLIGPAHLAGVLLFVLLTGSWLGAAVAAEGWEVLAQPLAEAGEKSLGWTAAAWARAVAKPAAALAMFLPWTILLWVVVRPSWWRVLEPTICRFAQSAVAFAATGFVLLMIVAAPESRYFLPLCVPLGVLCGTVVEVEERGPQWARPGVAAVLILTAVAGAGAIAVGLSSAVASDLSGTGRALAVCVGVAALGAVAGGLRWRSHGEMARLLLAVAICHWLISTVVTEPHRAETRSLRSVAADFEPHLEPGETLWTTPVAPTFHHSSLFYYLRRPVRTVTGASRPEPGSHLVVFSDEPEDRPDYELPVDYSVVASATQQGYVFELRRVE